MRSTLDTLARSTGVGGSAPTGPATPASGWGAGGGLELCGALAGFCLAASWATGDHSWVDRLWSIAPAVYAWLAAAAAGWHPRPLLMAGLATAWGLRLSYNFYRKGGYGIGEEDYRWPVLRTRITNPVAWQLFNIGFICGFQHLLLWLLAAPASVPGGDLNALDALAAAIFLALFVLEALADEQQWYFQQSKHGKALRRTDLAADYRRGFLSSGLFRFSRHPNFFAEQGLWWAFYMFSVAAGEGGFPTTAAGWLNPNALGATVLTILFQGSTRFTEELSCLKYRQYPAYQACTSMLIPLPSRGMGGGRA